MRVSLTFFYWPIVVHQKNFHRIHDIDWTRRGVIA